MEICRHYVGNKAFYMELYIVYSVYRAIWPNSAKLCSSETIHTWDLKLLTTRIQWEQCTYFRYIYEECYKHDAQFTCESTYTSVFVRTTPFNGGITHMFCHLIKVILTKLIVTLPRVCRLIPYLFNTHVCSLFKLLLPILLDSLLLLK